MQNNYNYGYPNNLYPRPIHQLKTNRGLVKFILLNMITFGIYGIVVMSAVSTDINHFVSLCGKIRDKLLFIIVSGGICANKQLFHFEAPFRIRFLLNRGLVNILLHEARTNTSFKFCRFGFEKDTV